MKYCIVLVQMVPLRPARLLSGLPSNFNAELPAATERGSAAALHLGKSRTLTISWVDPLQAHTARVASCLEEVSLVLWAIVRHLEELELVDGRHVNVVHEVELL